VLELVPGVPLGADSTILLLGAHCDDIEIGCGATVRRLVEAHPDACFQWIVFSSNEERAAEARRAAGEFLRGAERVNVEVESFRDGFLPYEGGRVKDHFEALKRRIRPDVVFTHYRHDAHQDHRLLCELTWNTFRDHLILEYEVPKFDGDLGSPNVFVDAPEAAVADKIRILEECYGSQHGRTWFDERTFRALLRLRGIEANAPSGLAEAFYGRKLRLVV
jgi:LmbE family N-acetylglucosaminyl deacetylase